MNFPFNVIALSSLYAVSISFAKAETPASPNPGVEATVEEAASAVKKISPADLATVAEASSDQDSRMKFIRERSAQLRARQVAFINGVADGSIDPHAQLRADWPELQKKVAALKSLQASIAAGGPDAPKRSKQLFDALQEIGNYLKSAQVPAAVSLKKRIFSDEQVTEAERIYEKIHNMVPATGNDEGGPLLKLIGPKDRTTILFLSVPVTVTAPPKSVVFFECEMGGHFQSSGLPVAEVQADDNGLATVNWISTGDSTGDANLAISSPQTVNRIDLGIRVVDLILKTPANFVP